MKKARKKLSPYERGLLWAENPGNVDWRGAMAAMDFAAAWLAGYRAALRDAKKGKKR